MAKIRLIPCSENSFENLIRWIESEEELYLWAGSVFHYPLTKEQLHSYLKTKNSQIYTLLDDETGKQIGHGEIGRIDKPNKSASLCRLLIGEKVMRGKGIGKLLVDELLKICFNELKLHRVDLNVADFNKGGIVCYEKSGFQIEGKLRDVKKVGAKYWSIYTMSILEEEYRARR